MCFRLAKHITNCETRRISTLEVRPPEFDFDIYHPFEAPRTCEHHVEENVNNLTLCPSHGTCCDLSFKSVCVSWVNFGGPGGIIKCRGFDRHFHIIIPRNGCNVEINRQFIEPDNDAVQLTDEEEQSLYEAQVDYINEGARVRTVLEDSRSSWITQVNPPYDWRPTIDIRGFGRVQNLRMLGRFLTACERWERTCPVLKIAHDPPQHEAIKETQSVAPYWYKALKVPRSGHEGTPLPGPEGFIDDPVPEAGEGPAGPAGMDGGLIDSPGGDQSVSVAEQESSDDSIPFLPEASLDGPNQIFSASPAEENGAVLEGDDEPVLEEDDGPILEGDGEAVLEGGEQGPPPAPVALGGLAPVAVLGDEPAGGHAQVPFGEVFAQVYGEAQAAVQALANPGWSAEQLSAMRDAIVQRPPGTAPGVRVEHGLVGIPVTGMVWLPAEGLLNSSQGDQYTAPFYLDNVDDRGHHRGEDGLLRLPAGILWRLLNTVTRDIPQASIEDQNRNGDGPPMSPLTDPEGPGGSGEASRPFESGQSQRGGEGESSTNTNTTRRSDGNRENDEPLPPTLSPSVGEGDSSTNTNTTRRSSGEGDSSTNTNTTRRSGGNQGNDGLLPPTQSPSGGSAQSSILHATPILDLGTPLRESGSEANGSRHSGSLPSANPSVLREGGNSEEGTTELLSDMSNGALQELENALDAAGSSVPRKTRKRAAEEDDDEVEGEPTPPRPTRRQPAKRRRVEEPVEEPRYKFRQRRKVNYK